LPLTLAFLTPNPKKYQNGEEAGGLGGGKGSKVFHFQIDSGVRLFLAN